MQVRFSRLTCNEHFKKFCRRENYDTPVYKAFWEDLRKDKSISGEFGHNGNPGKHLWIQSSFVPIKDSSGTVTKVVEYGVAIMQQRESVREIARQMEAFRVCRISLNKWTRGWEVFILRTSVFPG